MTITEPTGIDVLAVPLTKAAVSECGNGTNATIRDYLVALLRVLWHEGDEFSGKRPFGNSGWQYDLYDSLVAAGLVAAERDEDGDYASVDEAAADKLIHAAITALGGAM